MFNINIFRKSRDTKGKFLRRGKRQTKFEFAAGPGSIIELFGQPRVSFSRVREERNTKTYCMKQ